MRAERRRWADAGTDRTGGRPAHRRLFPLDHPSPVVPLCGRRAAGRPGLRFGGFRARVKGEFKLGVFLSGTIGNAAIAVFLTWLGQKLGLPLYLAAVLVFGTRMFQNFAEIRRELLTSKQKRAKISQDIVRDGEDGTK